MKLLKILALTLGVVLVMTGMAFGQSISGSDHDFTGKSWNTGGEICAVCHTPHNATAEQPLWDRSVTAATFTTYSSNTMDVTPGQPAGTSKLCLSCHDGTLGLENFGANKGTTTNNLIGGGANLGTNLSEDHPVSIDYDHAADGGLHDPANTNSGLGGTIAADMLFAGKVECASCHDVHNDTQTAFLRKSNAASALCLTCHNK